MNKISHFALWIGLIATGCGGSGAPPADDPANTPEPEPVEVITPESAPADTADSTTENEATTTEDESAVSESADNAPEAATEETPPSEPETPPPSGDLQSYVNAGTGYTPEYRTVMDNMDTFKQCYLDAMRVDPDLAGSLTIKFTVLKSGKVKTAKATVNELNDAVSKCVLNAIKKIKFPRRANKRTVEYPFKFIPSPS